MNERSKKDNLRVAVYKGYGHAHNMIIFGHVFKNNLPFRENYSTNMFVNIRHLLRLFLVKPVAGIGVQLDWRGQIIRSVTENDGFFSFEWQSETAVEAGWHQVVVNCLDENGEISGTGLGEIDVPSSTQYGFISDIDDTILISHSGNTRKKLQLLFTKNPHTRKTFNEVVQNYQLFAKAHTVAASPNPFFYISNSEWNLYNDLVDFFEHNGLPKGSFILNHLKRWFQLFKTGQSEKDNKLRRATRILETFPKQHFVLLGDNSQKDPEIYSSLAKNYPTRVFAVYIRNIDNRNEQHTREILSGLDSLNVFTCFFSINEEAIDHARKIKLID
ncbi:MAG: phosphatase domain-containing protein [Chitinophagaceae bacterium]